MLHDTLPIRVKDYMKSEKIKVYFWDLENVFGFLYKKHIFVNKNINFYKKRFNICHELGHYFYGDKESLPNFRHIKSYQEKRADEFAMKALLPEKSLLEEGEKYSWDLTALEKVFGVEMHVIEKRLKNIFQIK